MIRLPNLMARREGAWNGPQTGEDIPKNKTGSFRHPPSERAVHPCCVLRSKMPAQCYEMMKEAWLFGDVLEADEKALSISTVWSVLRICGVNMMRELSMGVRYHSPERTIAAAGAAFACAEDDFSDLDRKRKGLGVGLRFTRSFRNGWTRLLIACGVVSA